MHMQVTAKAVRSKQPAHLAAFLSNGDVHDWRFHTMSILGMAQQLSAKQVEQAQSMGTCGYWPHGTAVILQAGKISTVNEHMW
jgi:hypothetical protein